jgi:hypothetical protein
VSFLAYFSMSPSYQISPNLIHTSHHARR